MRKLLTAWIVVFAFAYIAYAGLMFATQRSLLFPIAGDTTHRPTVHLPDYASAVELPGADGNVRGLFLRGPPGRAPVLMFSHGNAELADELVDRFDAIRALGVHVFVLEYPGYGGAAGVTTADSIAAAQVVAYDWLAANPAVDSDRIVAMGVSIGGGPAAELTRHRRIRALVLLSTFSTLDALAGEMYLPALLLRDRFDSEPTLRDYRGPVLIAHGRHDEIIPFAHALRLVAAARNKRFQPYECGHADCPYREPAFAELLGDFLRGYGVLAPTPGVEIAARGALPPHAAASLSH